MKKTIHLLVSNSNVSFTEYINIANLLESQFKYIYITDNGILPVFPKLTSASLDRIFISPENTRKQRLFTLVQIISLHLFLKYFLFVYQVFFLYYLIYHLILVHFLVFGRMLLVFQYLKNHF